MVLLVLTPRTGPIKEVTMFKRSGSRNYYTSIRVDGIRRVRSLGTSDHKLAKVIESKLRVKVAEGKSLDLPKGAYTTVSKLLDRYLLKHSAKYKKSHKSDLHNAKYIRKFFGEMKLTDVTPSVISDYESKRDDDGVSQSTIRLELSLLSHAFTLALKKWGLVHSHPFALHPLPKAADGRIRYLKPGERSRLYKAVRKRQTWMYPIVVTFLETGARATNVLTMMWSQVDFKRRLVIFFETKSGKPVTLPMSDLLYETLIAHKNEQETNKVMSEDSYVFPRLHPKDGQPRKANSFWKAFRRLCVRARIEDLSPHDMRHDCATRLVSAGVPLRVVKEWLGHSDIKTTMKYSHFAEPDAAFRDAVERVQSFYGKDR